MTTKPYMTERQLAARWRMSKKTLTNWRWAKKGPKYEKFGHSVLYAVADILAFETVFGRPPQRFSYARGH